MLSSRESERSCPLTGNRIGGFLEGEVRYYEGTLARLGPVFISKTAGVFGRARLPMNPDTSRTGSVRDRCREARSRRAPSRGYACNHGSDSASSARADVRCYVQSYVGQVGGFNCVERISPRITSGSGDIIRSYGSLALPLITSAPPLASRYVSHACHSNGVVEKEAIEFSDRSFAARQAEYILIVFLGSQAGVNFNPPTLRALRSVQNWRQLFVDIVRA